LYLITNIVLFVAESFSKVFCTNYFWIIPSLIQFKYAPVSNRAIISILKLFENIKVIFMIYFFEVIWVKTCKQSWGTYSIIDNTWSNAWFSTIWSCNSNLELDWLSIFVRRYCKITKSFYWACLRYYNSILRVLILDCRSEIIAIGLYFFSFYWEFW